jgi:DNA-binding NtrC family response regulator
VKHRVLIIDDDAQLRELVREYLAPAGHDVLFAQSAEDTRRQFDQPEPDVILLDWRLPDADGLELLPELKNRWPTSEVIFVTGFASFDTAVNAGPSTS